jgi:hypothetical protein
VTHRRTLPRAPMSNWRGLATVRFGDADLEHRRGWFGLVPPARLDFGKWVRVARSGPFSCRPAAEWATLQRGVSWAVK